MKFLSS
jgi:hypothetical protein